MGISGPVSGDMYGILRAFAWPSFLEAPIELPLHTGFVGYAYAHNINNHGLVDEIVGNGWYQPDNLASKIDQTVWTISR